LDVRAGYFKKAGKGTGGYWKLVRSFENDYTKSASDDYYSSAWSGGDGSYTYVVRSNITVFPIQVKHMTVAKANLLRAMERQAV
jgi:hypothetical protein